MKMRSVENTVVHQHTRTVNVPNDFPRGKSYVNFNPQDLLPSSIHGPSPTTSAGRTTRTESPVWNVPTTGCRRHVFSQGATMPNSPDTPCNRRNTLLRGNMQKEKKQWSSHSKKHATVQPSRKRIWKQGPKSLWSCCPIWPSFFYKHCPQLVCEQCM